MFNLNLPEFSFKIKKENDKYLIFDRLRKKYIHISPEEWVRQNFIEYLILEKKYPASLMANEVAIEYNGLKKRCDSLVYNNYGEIIAIIEYKAPNVKITQKVFDQIAVYNMQLKVNFLIVSNGLEHFCCQVNHEKMKYVFLQEIPSYEDLISLTTP